MPDKTQSSLSLDDFLPYRLSVLSNAVSRQVADIYEREFALSIWQWRVIAVLGEQAGMTSTEVAQRTLMDKPTVSRALASLLERRLVERVTDEEDRRRMPLALTDAGLSIYRAIIPRALACEQALLDSLTTDEAALLQKVLGKLALVVSPEEGLWKTPDS
jgi:DNA-binding MarR family transcriptional regulator